MCWCLFEYAVFALFACFRWFWRCSPEFPCFVRSVYFFTRRVFTPHPHKPPTTPHPPRHSEGFEGCPGKGGGASVASGDSDKQYQYGTISQSFLFVSPPTKQSNSLSKGATPHQDGEAEPTVRAKRTAAGVKRL